MPLTKWIPNQLQNVCHIQAVNYQHPQKPFQKETEENLLMNKEGQLP